MGLLTRYCLTGPFVPVLLKFRLKKEGIIEKFLWASRLWVEPILVYILKFVKKNYTK